MKPTEKIGVRAIALFEAAKGTGALILSFILLSLRNRNFKEVAADIIGYFKLNPEGWLAHRIDNLIGGLNSAYIELFFAALVVYFIVRIVEAYGLWRLRAWAQWLAIISGSAYIPIELYELFTKPNFISVGVLLFNIALVAYLYYFRQGQKHEEEISRTLTEAV